MLHTKGYRHTHTICNTYCFHMETVVVRTCLSVLLYVHCPSYTRIMAVMVKEQISGSRKKIT